MKASATTLLGLLSGASIEASKWARGTSGSRLGEKRVTGVAAARRAKKKRKNAARGYALKPKGKRKKAA